MGKWTMGPWKLIDHDIVRLPSGVLITLVERGNPADARLAVEAPAMAELLTRFSQWKQCIEFGLKPKDSHINGLVEEARALLARIEGE